MFVFLGSINNNIARTDTVYDFFFFFKSTTYVKKLIETSTTTARDHKIIQIHNMVHHTITNHALSFTSQIRDAE